MGIEEGQKNKKIIYTDFKKKKLIQKFMIPLKRLPIKNRKTKTCCLFFKMETKEKRRKRKIIVK